MNRYSISKKRHILAFLSAFAVILSLKSVEVTSFNLANIEGLSNIVPILIIGGGPAGMSSAIYTARSRIPTLVIDNQEEVLGGESLVENWPGLISIKRKDLFAALIKQGKRFGAQLLQDSVESIDVDTWPFKVSTKNGHTLNALAVIIATGSQSHHEKIEGQDEYLGKGVALCSYCDAPKARGKDVVIAGRLSVAIAEAANIAPYANQVFIVTPDLEPSLTAQKREKIRNLSNISFIYGTKIVEIRGNESAVTSVVMKKMDTNEIENKPIDMVFVSSYHQGNTQIVPTLPQDEDNYLLTSPGTQQVQPGIFVAGEATDRKYRQAGVSSGDGIKAGVDAILFNREIGINEAVLDSLKPQLFEQLKPSVTSRVYRAHSKDELLSIIQRPNTIIVALLHMHGCPACKAMLPVFERVGSNFRSKRIFFVTAELGECPGIDETFNIQSVPTTLIFSEGKIRNSFSGSMTDEQFIDFIGKQRVRNPSR